MFYKQKPNLKDEQACVLNNNLKGKYRTESFVNQYGMTLDDYLAQTGSDEETFNREAEEYGLEKAKSCNCFSR